MANSVIETERLILRDWQESDRTPFIMMNQDLEVMRYFPSTLNEQESADMIQEISTSINTRGYGFFAVEEKKTGATIGFTGLQDVTFDCFFTPCVEIGWRLQKEYWGQGFATEAAKACLDFAFNQLKLDELYSFASILNNRSINIMKKIGLHKIQEFDHPKVANKSILKQHVLYGLKRAEYVS